ncbi:MAG: MBL fold metallo-hydrolase [Mailhella sp.]|nr:MBL fold metallo-hydrolase [Mailhella sp.]
MLVECGGKRMLVDGGGSASPFFDCGKSILAPALTYGRLPHLDAVFVSHTDVDHARGLRWILEHFSVDAMYWSQHSAQQSEHGEGLAIKSIAEKKRVPVRILSAGEAVELPGGVSLETLWPPQDEHSVQRLSVNDASLVLRLVCKGHGLALLCGDVKRTALGRLLRSGADLSAEALVLPHHGASSSFFPEFYSAVRPELAVASAGSFNQYGFPAEKVRSELGRKKIPLFSTGEYGSLRMDWQMVHAPRPEDYGAKRRTLTWPSRRP